MIQYHVSGIFDAQIQHWVGLVSTSIGVAHRTPWCDDKDTALRLAESWLAYRRSGATCDNSHHSGVAVDGRGSN